MMKRFLLLFCILLFGSGAIAQDKLYLVFEMMKVDNEQEAAYAETEDFWVKIHEQRIKNGDCIGWNLWALRPGGENQGYQYMTVSLYNDPVKMFEGGDFNKAVTGAYPELSEEEIDEKMRKTSASRDLSVRVYLEGIDRTKDDFDIPLGTLAVFNYMKANPGQAGAYEKMESEIFKPMHQKQVDAGERAAWGLLRNMMYGSEIYATHIAVDFFTGFDQFFNGGTEPSPAQVEAFQKANQDINAIRDLKSIRMATLIKKVR